MGICFRFLALETPWTEEPGGLQYMGLQRIEHNIMKGLTASIGGPEVPKRQRK